MNTDLIYCSPEDTIFEAAKKLSENKISGMPVLENGKLVGIVSLTDIVKYLSSELNKSILDKFEKFNVSDNTTFLILKLIEKELRFAKELRKLSKNKVRDIMSKKVIVVDPDSSLIEAASLMEKHDITRLPVVENEKLVGIISKSDLVRAIIEG